MNNDTENSLSDDSKKVEVLVRTMRSGARYTYNLYDINGNLILESHTPITEGVIRHLQANNVEYLYYDPSTADDASAGGTGTESDSGLNPEQSVIDEDLRDEVFNHAKDFLEYVRGLYDYSPGESISKGKMDQSRDLVGRVIDNLDENKDGVFQSITRLKNHDEYIFHHSTNVSILAALLGMRMDYKKEIKVAMGVGGLLHDLGKTSISKDILHKAQLNDEEFDMIKSHTHVGHKLIEENEFVHDLEKRIVLMHHERSDGEGYPFGFELDHFKDTLPREVRLFSMCNLFSMMVQAKPGDQELSSRDALRRMVNMVYAPYKKIHYILYPDFREFIRCLGFVINEGNFFMNRGDLVRMNTGEVAIIEEMNRLYPMNPKVQVVKNSKMETLKRPILIDMLKDHNTYIANVFDRSKK
jgi:hypothetical protein